MSTLQIFFLLKRIALNTDALIHTEITGRLLMRETQVT